MDLACDVLVVGSGAGGLATAITARRHGLSALVIEKEPVFGGTTAFSGGVLWIPGNRHGRANHPGDTLEAARAYLRAETGNLFQPDMVDAFLRAGPRMLDWFERETAVRFVATLYPDYHPDREGGADVGRSVLAAPFDARALGANLARLRPPLESITFMGMMFNSSNADIQHFFRATRSARSLAYVARRLATHAVERVRYGRGVNVTSGNALAARLAKSCFDLGIEIRTRTPALRLLRSDGRVVGVETPGGRITARKGVVLACGGYAWDLARRAGIYAHLKDGGEHFSPVPDGNTGDGIRLGEEAGGVFEAGSAEPAAWMPVSRVPGKGLLPHLLDRYKPGMIAVGADGSRFTNESESYHDVGAAMIRQRRDGGDASCWLICDHRAIRRYGLGHAKPAPMPLRLWTRNGYLRVGRTLAELAHACGLDAARLEASVADYNRGAARGVDEAFGRGTTSFNRYLADPEHRPNPCVAPLETAPFYAVRLEIGDLGTFDGLRTTVAGEVLDRSGMAIAGLYAVGNDRSSVMGGTYPGAGITLGPAMTFGWITGRHLAGIAETEDA